jgi:hypothetical protein
MKRHARLMPMLVAFALTTSTEAQEYQSLDPSPLMPARRSEMLMRHASKSYNRQYEEKWKATESADPTGWFQVDLKPYCNMNLYSREGVTAPVQFHAMELGRREFYGVPVDIIKPAENANKTAVAVPSTRYLTKVLPEKAEISLGKNARVLYFLYATYYTLVGGEQYFMVHYADGTEHKIPFVGTKQSGDWYHASTRLFTDQVHYVVVPSSKGSKLHFRNMHMMEWMNPHPDKSIKSVTIKSDKAAEMAIFLAAISGHSGKGVK